MDAGLTTEEARRLLSSLYVHSPGFLRMLADSFAQLPQRSKLLHAVWAGFATLIERARINGAHEICYASVMAANDREAKATQEALRTELARVSLFLQKQLTEVVNTGRIRENPRAQL